MQDMSVSTIEHESMRRVGRGAILVCLSHRYKHRSHLHRHAALRSGRYILWLWERCWLLASLVESPDVPFVLSIFVRCADLVLVFKFHGIWPA